MVEPLTSDVLEPTDSIHFNSGRLVIVDQTILPGAEAFLELDTPADVSLAIKRLAVRGAMAIGVAGAYGVLLGALHAPKEDADSARSAARKAIELISSSRPTARNLFWACERMEEALDEGSEDDLDTLTARLFDRAEEVARNTIETNARLVDAGQEVVGNGERFLTHCNSGAMAAVRFGTALGVLIEAHRLGKGVHVYVDETRPLLQGSRISAWELERGGVPYTVLPDGAAGALMAAGTVDGVITGADRIAANGDTANKIGTYGLAVLAAANEVPFYIAAPFSTVDYECESGRDIVIEERDPEEVRRFRGLQVAPPAARVFNPAFDVTPAERVTGIVTESGVLRPPYGESLGR